MDFLQTPKQEAGKLLSAGCLLIAEPFLQGPDFSRSVVLLCEHSKNGSIGFVLNKGTEWILSDLFPEFSGPAITIYTGGPVQHDTLHMIHRMPELGGVSVGNGIYWGGIYDDLQGLMAEKGYNPSDIKLLLGYSGWSPGQLEQEIEEGSWYIGESDAAILFDTDNAEVWTRAIRALGKDYAHLANFPVNPQHN